MRFLVVSTLVLFVLMQLALFQARCLPHQTLALMQLKQALSDPSHLASWNSTLDCCHWPGISCDSPGSHVTGVELTSLSFTGTVDSASLGQLVKLKSLALHSNHFISSSALGKLHQLPGLTHLNLSGSGYSYEIAAPAISHIRSLISLDLSSEPSVGRSLNLKALVANLSNLEELYLDGINISSHGSEWSEILASSLPELRLVSLGNCSISGPLRPSLLNLTHLTSLSLHSNDLASPVPAFLSSLSSLQILNLSSCNLVGEFPHSVLRIRSLRTLDVSSNPSLAGRIPEFPKSTSIHELRLSNTKFSGQLPDSICKLSNLAIMQFSKSNYNGSLPPCLSDRTSLVFLDLSSNNFTGQVPPLAKLSQLAYIDLSNNRFSGPIPHIGDKLVHLQAFKLQNNGFNGSIPSSLFTIPSLQILQLQQNKLSGEISDFSSKLDTSSLMIVNLGSNHLHGSIHKSLFELPRLIVLELSSNNFSGAVELSWLENLKYLNILGLSNCGLSVQTLVSTFPQLRTLKLSSCNLTQVPEFLRNQTILLELDLSNNFIHGDIPKWIWEMESLTHLNLSNNFLTGLEQPHNNISVEMLDLHSNLLQGPIPLPSSSLFSGAILDFSNNKFNSTIPSDIGTYLSVTIFFSLENNSLHGTIPESICEALNLRALYLSRNSLSGPIPPCLLQMNNLLVLNLAENLLIGTIPNLSSGCKLRILELYVNHLQGPVPLSLQECENLEVLNIGNNAINDEFPGWLARTPNLLVLVLRENEFHGPIVAQTNELQNLQIIDLSTNNFSGMIPPECFHGWKAMMGGNHTENLVNNNDQEPDVHDFKIKVSIFGSLDYHAAVTINSKGLELEYQVTTFLTSIDFSDNNLKGVIPDSIGNLTELYLLNLSHNALIGNIPESFGSLLHLESLDLSFNNLTGHIPYSLAQIPRLPFLNLSYNHLEGKIPESTQFGSFENSSFEGNERLCGPPLSKKCGDPGGGEGTLRSDGGGHVQWIWIALESGYVSGLAIVFFPLMLCRKWRQWYIMKMELMLWKISIFLHMERWVYKYFLTEDSAFEWK